MRVLLCNTMGGGSDVLLDGWDDGTGPTTIGRQTDGGRAANGDAAAEESFGGFDEEANPGVGVPSVEHDAIEPNVVGNPPGAVGPIRGGSIGSDLGPCAIDPAFKFPSVVESNPPCDCVVESVADLCSGVDVSGGGNGPAPFFTLRLSGGSSGTALSFFLELLPVPSLPLAGWADDDAE